MEYDVIVIGGGPAGYNSAEYASKKGLKTLLIEKAALGGTCLNVGCIPTKALLYASKLFHNAKDHGQEFGIDCQDVSVSQSRVVEKKDELVRSLVKGLESGLRKNKVTVVNGQAVLKREGNDLVVGTEGETYRGKNIILATGSSVMIPPIVGVDAAIETGLLLTSDEILSLPALPEKLAIVGGGVIGFEMAAYFQQMGSQVTVVEMMDKVLGESDREISALLQKQLEKMGVVFHLSSQVLEVKKDALVFAREGEKQTLECDKILMAVGRRANLSGLGLENVGIAVDRGVIAIDDHCRTNLANVYAIGDVSGKITLAHVGYREGEVAVNQILGEKDAMDYSAICSVVYTNPEAAFVGLSEEGAAEAGLDVDVKKVSLNYSGRHLIEQGMSDGLCKIIIDKKRGIVVGGAIMSAYASEYIYSLALMIQNKIPVESVKRTVFPHPTVCEIVREALMS